MADNLQILGKTYTNVTGIKAINTNGDTVTFVKGESGDDTGISAITGTYTPIENQNTFTINVGDLFTHFIIYATSNVYAAGSGVRTTSVIVYDSSMDFTWRIGSNAAGTAGSASMPTTGFSISGTNFVVNTDQYLLGGYTHNWIAW